MTKKTNKNLFGTTVTALNDEVVSCAYMEPIDGTSTFYVHYSNDYPQLGKLLYIIDTKLILLLT